MDGECESMCVCDSAVASCTCACHTKYVCLGVAS